MKYAIFVIISLIALSSTYASAASSHSSYSTYSTYSSYQNNQHNQQGGLLGALVLKDTSCECHYFLWTCGCLLHSQTPYPVCGPC